MFEVVFSKKAEETFGFIQLQILERWGTGSVIKFEQRTMLVLETIVNLPFIFARSSVFRLNVVWCKRPGLLKY